MHTYHGVTHGKIEPQKFNGGDLGFQRFLRRIRIRPRRVKRCGKTEEQIQSKRISLFNFKSRNSTEKILRRFIFRLTAPRDDPFWPPRSLDEFREAVNGRHQINSTKATDVTAKLCSQSIRRASSRCRTLVPNFADRGRAPKDSRIGQISFSG